MNDFELLAAQLPDGTSEAVADGLRADAERLLAGERRWRRPGSVPGASAEATAYVVWRRHVARMTLSARNRIAGTVTSVRTDGLMAEVVVETGDGQEVTAIITEASVERLGIEVGENVSAVVKATEVMIET